MAEANQNPQVENLIRLLTSPVEENVMVGLELNKTLNLLEEIPFPDSLPVVLPMREFKYTAARIYITLYPTITEERMDRKKMAHVFRIMEIVKISMEKQKGQPFDDPCNGMELVLIIVRHGLF